MPDEFGGRLRSGNVFNQDDFRHGEVRAFNRATSSLDWMPFQQATEGGFPDGKIKGPFHLPAGTRLWRFDDKHAQLDPAGIVSPWWCLRDNYKTGPFSEGKSLTYCMWDAIIKNISFETYARVAACVKMHWNGMTKLQLAYLKNDAYALWGEFQPMSLVDVPQDSLPGNDAAVPSGGRPRSDAVVTPGGRPRSDAVVTPGGRPISDATTVPRGRPRSNAVGSDSPSEFQDWRGRIQKFARRLQVYNRFVEDGYAHLFRTGIGDDERQRLEDPANMLGSIKGHQLWIPNLKGCNIEYTRQHLKMTDGIVWAFLTSPDPDRLLERPRSNAF